MIEKIIRIQNVGKFENYAASGDVAFRPLTLIYGENASGKTMLSAILRSIQSGDARYVEERRTLGGSGGPTSVEVRVDGETITYSNCSWSKAIPHIEIFDERFVTENVYAGDVIQPEHRRKLHRFAIGEQAVQLAQRIDDILEEIQGINPQISRAEAAIQRHIVGGIDVAGFVALESREGIDQAITAKQREIEALKKANEIREKEQLSTFSLPEIPFADVRALLSKELPDVSAEAERTVREHLAQCMDEHGEEWINHGMAYIKEEQCPFCGQPLRGLGLITAYQDYFSQAYAGLKDEIRHTSQQVEEIFSQQALLSLQGRIERNRSLGEFWNQHVDAELLDISFQNIQTAWSSLHGHLMTHLQSKAASPLEPQVMGEELNQAQAGFQRLRQECMNYGEQVSKVNERINVMKVEVSSGNLAAAESELEQLTNTRRRHEQTVAEICSNYEGLKARKQRLESRKEEARGELEDFTTNLLRAYEAKINKYLTVFGADFSIVETRERYFGGTPRVEYLISINHEQVVLEASEGPEPRACFGNTLSSGDKTTLALAFFLARLDEDQNWGQRVVLFDDPLSSLDIPRRTQTQQQIARIADRAEQVILLSHDPYFLRLVWDKALKSETKTLCIKRSGASNIIDEWDVERETRGDYFRNYFALAEYLDNGPSGDRRAVARCIRPLLEGNLRVRFPGKFGMEQSLGDMIAMIRDAGEGSVIRCLTPHLQELDEINAYSLQYHHAQNPNADGHPITDSELRSYVQRALRIISGVLEIE